MTSVLLPPSVPQSGALLNLCVGETTALPRMDMIGVACNPYFKIEFAGNSFKNHHKDYETGKSVIFNEIISIPVYEPVMSDHIAVTLNNPE